VGVGAPAGSVGMIMIGNEFALVLVKESVEVIGRRDLIRFEAGTSLDDAKAVIKVEKEPLSREPHRLLLREREPMVFVEP
jgi:hypothetical protein